MPGTSCGTGRLVASRRWSRRRRCGRRASWALETGWIGEPPEHQPDQQRDDQHVQQRRRAARDRRRRGRTTPATGDHDGHEDSGPRNAPHWSLKPRPRQHREPGRRGGDGRQRQVAAGVGRQSLSSCPLGDGSDLVRGSARPGGVGAGAAEVLPDQVEPVARAQGHGAPALSDQQRPRRVGHDAEPGAAAGAQAETSRASARAVPAWWCIRRSIGPSASVIAPITASSRPPCVGLGQPAGVDAGGWSPAGRRPAPRAAARC